MQYLDAFKQGRWEGLTSVQPTSVITDLDNL